MNPRDFFAELQRRNVYKVAVAYAVVGWLLLQGASIVLPSFEAPAWTMKALILVLIVGLPVAVILAWAFEITPEGIKRAEDVDLHKSITHQTGRRLVAVTAVLALIAAGLFVFQLVRPKTTISTLTSASAIPNKSVAVLPFENLSDDKANAYFVEGIQDELLTRLGKITDLKVIGRSSTQRLKSQTDDFPAIAKQLGVAHLLEGSVQKAGDQVRINVQLINASTLAHLWSDTYDRNVKDIFIVETEVAKTIAGKLAAKLSGSEEHAISTAPTDKPEAHQLYLKGRFFWNKRTGDDLKRAAEFFTQATVVDPNYALAYAGLADAYVLMPNLGAGTPSESYPKAKAAAERALQLDENLAEAHTSLGCVLLYYDLDFTQAGAEFQRAISLNPNYPTAHQWYGDTVLENLSRFDESIAELKRALELDPLSLIAHTDLANSLRTARREQAAIEILHRALEIDPNFYYAHRIYGLLLVAQERVRKGDRRV